MAARRLDLVGRSRRSASERFRSRNEKRTEVIDDAVSATKAAVAEGIVPGRGFLYYFEPSTGPRTQAPG
jgi:hypothetical protein